MAVDMAFSVGTSTSDLKTGSPTISISVNAGTFSAGQTGNIGVGDRVEYVENGTAQAGAASTITLQSDESATTSYFIDDNITIVSGTGSGQTKRITAYNGSTKVATVDSAWTTNPDSTSVYEIYKGLFICGKTSSTVWTLRWARSPSASLDTVTGKTVSSIKRAYNKLETAIHGTATTYDRIRKRLNSWDLTTLDIRLLVSCYADGDDASLVTVPTNWITDSTRYIFIFTPKTAIDNSSPGLANQNQRHDGTVDGTGYTIETTASTSSRGNIVPRAAYTKVYGIKVIRRNGNWEYGCAIGCDYTLSSSGHNYIELAYNLVINEDLLSNTFLIGNDFADATAGQGWSIHDNIVIGISSTSREYIGIAFFGNYQNTSGRQLKVYNNTVYGNFTTAAIRIDASLDGGSDYLPLVKNNYAANIYSTVADYVFASDYTNADTKFAYNRSDDTTAGTSNSNGRCTVVNAVFNDTTMATCDLHIGVGSSLINAGIGPSSDSNVSTLDIDGNTRSGSTCDTGADELPVAAFKAAWAVNSNQLIYAGSH